MDPNSEFFQYARLIALAIAANYFAYKIKNKSLGKFLAILCGLAFVHYVQEDNNQSLEDPKVVEVTKEKIPIRSRVNRNIITDYGNINCEVIEECLAEAKRFSSKRYRSIANFYRKRAELLEKIQNEPDERKRYWIRWRMIHRLTYINKRDVDQEREHNKLGCERG